MDVTISFRHLTPDESLKRYAEEKLSRLQRYVEAPLDIHVVLSSERAYRQRVDVMFTMNGVVINAHEVQGEMRAAVDKIQDKLEARLKKYREKVKRYREERPHRTAEDIEKESSRIIVTKSIEAKPMDPEEAVMQLRASGDSFIIFRDNERENICVMYKRRDGNYGLVETVGKGI